MTINEHISQLLFSYDCVIIPDFGGFVTRYYPAEIQEGTYMFRPPSKRVSFNARLKENDGLLAHYMSKQEDISYQEALQSIEISVRSWRRILESGNKITLEGIGKMYANAEGSIQFSAALDVNFLTTSYGLTIFRSPAISQDSYLQQNILQSAETSVNKLETRDKIYYTQAFSSMFRAALFLVPLGTIVFLALDSGDWLNRDSKNNTSAIIPGVELILDSTKKRDTLATTYEQKPQQTAKPTDEKPVEIAPTENSTAQAEATPEVIKEIAAPNVENTASKQVALAPYQIIVGAFGLEENAEALFISLKNAGFNPVMLPKEGNLYKVSAGGFNQSADAQPVLARVKAEVNAEAWVKKF